MRVLVVALAAVALAGCEKRSKLYCEKNPEDLANCEPTDAMVEPPMMCTDNTSCTDAAKPFCELGAHICVECLASTDCTRDPGAPNCDPDSFTCEGCLAHTDCASNACLPDGTCGDDATVIYVDAQGLDGNDCTSQKPCATLARGAEVLTATRRYIKLTGAIVGSTTLTSKRASILAGPGTTLTGTADPVLKLQMSEVKVYDLEILCGTSPAAGGVKSEMASTTTLSNVYIHGCGKIAIEAKGGFLIVQRSRIADNNDGIVTDGSAGFSITSSIIVHNGNTGSSHGGVHIGTTVSGANRFEFNTVAHNTSKGGIGLSGGVTCPVSVTRLPAPNNLIVANSPDNTYYCEFDSSLVADDPTPMAFVNATAAPYDYHIGATSTARDNVTAASTVDEDFDGQFRPLGPAKDFGADEFKP